MSERLDIAEIRDEVVGVESVIRLPDGTKRPYINFDNASTTPVLRPVLDAVNEFMQWYASVGRGAGLKSRVSTRTLQEVRELVCEFVGADPTRDTVIFGKNATELLNRLARRIPFRPGDVVVSTAMEHHSNDLPWRAVARVEYVDVDESGRLDLDHLADLLKRHGRSVRLVTLSGASNVTGAINPIHDIAQMAHAVGAEVCVDAAQLAPHRTIRMTDGAEERRIDYLAFSAHKMYAPFGVGVLVARKDRFREGMPDHVGGGQVALVTHEDVLWSAPPARDEAGTPNLVGAVALGKAILSLQEIGLDAIAAHEAGLTQRLLARLPEIGGIRIYGDSNPEASAERLGVVPFSVEGMPHQKVAAILDTEGGIAVRNGLFCAHPYALRLLREPQARVAGLRDRLEKGLPADLPGLIRISFGVYNRRAEVDTLIGVLSDLAAGRFDGEYARDPQTGRFKRKGDAIRETPFSLIGDRAAFG